jgi:hypothetical protein
MYLRIAIGLLFVAFLTATHWKAYVVGKQTVRAEMMEAVRKTEKQARETEQLLVTQKQQIEVEYAKQKKVSDAVVGRTRNELDRLRDQLRSYSERQNSATCPRVDADPRDTIIRECSEAAQSLARVADENGLRLKALQSYVTEVCLGQQ